MQAVFWTVAYILNDSKIRQSVTQEISNNLKENNMKTFGEEISVLSKVAKFIL